MLTLRTIVYSPVLDMDIFIIDSSEPLSEGSPVFSDNNDLMPITGIDLYELEKGKLFAFLLVSAPEELGNMVSNSEPFGSDRNLDKKLFLEFIFK